MGLLGALSHSGAQVSWGFGNDANYGGIYAERYLIRDLTLIIAHARDIHHKPTYRTRLGSSLHQNLSRQLVEDYGYFYGILGG